MERVATLAQRPIRDLDMPPEIFEPILGGQPLLEAVLAASTASGSSLHGLEHWRRVGQNGLALAAETDGVDAEVVLLFALFHDSMRLNDGHDPDHGSRGSQLAHDLSHLIPL